MPIGTQFSYQVKTNSINCWNTIILCLNGERKWEESVARRFNFISPYLWLWIIYELWIWSVNHHHPTTLASSKFTATSGTDTLARLFNFIFPYLLPLQFPKPTSHLYLSTYSTTQPARCFFFSFNGVTFLSLSLSFPRYYTLTLILIITTYAPNSKGEGRGAICFLVKTRKPMLLFITNYSAANRHVFRDVLHQKQYAC